MVRILTSFVKKEDLSEVSCEGSPLGGGGPFKEKTQRVRRNEISFPSVKVYSG